MSKTVQIILEGTTSDFLEEVRNWFGNRGERASYASDGSVKVRISESKKASLLERLQIDGPKNLYRAWIISGHEPPFAVRGVAFDTVNKAVENSPGRHLNLGALPDELYPTSVRES